MMVAWTKVIAVKVGRIRRLMNTLQFEGFADRLDVGVKVKDDSKSFDLSDLKKGVELIIG